MANVIQGTHTLRDVLQITRAFVPNRFDNRDRDLLKRITVQKVTSLSPDRAGEPSIKYRVITYSYPQYGKYLSRKSKGAKKQRSIRHQYDTVLELDRLSIDTVHWRMRVGTNKDWVEKPPQNQIKQIYRENYKRWDQKRIKRHRKKAPYLDVGDYNSRVKGLNGDFVFRCVHAYWRAGHLFGDPRRGRKPSSLNPGRVVFLTKHGLHVVETLMKNGILGRDY